MLIKPRQIRVFFVALFLVIFCLSSGTKAMAEEVSIMTVDQVKPGMEGIGKTVIEGTKIVPFYVKVMGVVKGNGGKGDLILVRVGGKPIEEAGGIAQGMSGSPVYIDGKLIGAIGYGWELADHNLGLVTPINDMLKILKIQNKQKIALEEPLQIGDKKLSKILVSDQPVSQEKIRIASEEGTMIMTPVKTPLFVSGIQGRALTELQKKLESFNVEVMAGSGSGVGSKEEISLQPGSALGVQLVRGGVEMGAIGTVTYVKNGEILAFGHPFLNKGQVNLPLTTAYIHKTVPSIVAPFKLGSPVRMIGRITQDRSAGIGGEIGKYPPLTLVRVEINDKDLGKTERRYFEVIKDSNLATVLTTSGLLSTIDTSIDRIGKGTIKVSFALKGAGLPKEGVQRENLFYSPSDVSAVSLIEIIEALDLVVNNVYKDVDLTELKVTVEVEEKEKTARIEKAAAKNPQVYPGEIAEIEVTYKPFRGEAVNSIIKVKIPKDTPKGNLILNVLGGSIPPYMDPNAQEQGGGQGEGGNNQAQLPNWQMPSPFNSLEEMLDDFLKRNKNNEIIIEAAPQGSPGNAQVNINNSNQLKSKAIGLSVGAEERQELKKTNLLGEMTKTEEEPKIKGVLATEYVLEGFATVTLEVVDRK